MALVQVRATRHRANWLHNFITSYHCQVWNYWPGKCSFRL